MKKNPGRKQRRQLERSTHHNCFTKKYKSRMDRFKSFENSGFSFDTFSVHETGMVLARPSATKGVLKKMITRLLKKLRK